MGYCGELVRGQDPDRFMISMLAEPARRAALWALFAFNIEIAKTRSAVSETQLGLIRLQWWREAIGRIYDGGGAPEHEILRPLAAAIKAHELPRADFDMMIYAREFDLEDTLPGNLEGLMNYADFTSSPLLALAMRIAGEVPDAEPVRPVAVNYALAGILRSVPHFARERRCLLPEDLLAAHGQSVNKLYDGQLAPGLREVVRAVCAQRLEGMRTQSRILRAANALAMMYFRQIERAGHDVFDPKMAREPAFKALRVLFSVM